MIYSLVDTVLKTDEFPANKGVLIFRGNQPDQPDQPNQRPRKLEVT